MKIGLVSSTVPFVNGGYRAIVEGLASELIKRGHQAEMIWIPSTEDPNTLFQQMIAFRLLDLERHCERVITFRPPAHVVRHSNKVAWFIHHLRGFYDLWDTRYRPVADTAYWVAFRAALVAADTNALVDARNVFSNSKVVAERLRLFNGVKSEVLYPPVAEPQRFYNEVWGSEIVCICRVEHHKRQHLIVEAMRHVRSPVKLRIAGRGMTADYASTLLDTVARHGLHDRVTLDHRWISEGEKSSLLSTALAAAYVPVDEDSYGYPVLEAAHACKATVSLHDSGGVTEFIQDSQTGLLVEPDPQALAEAFDRLWTDRSLAQRLGENANKHIGEMNISWDHVVERLLS